MSYRISYTAPFILVDGPDTTIKLPCPSREKGDDPAIWAWVVLEKVFVAQEMIRAFSPTSHIDLDASLNYGALTS